MKKIDDVYTQGIIAFVDQFTYADEELRQYVVYTYYDQEEKPLYVGKSKDFYNTHYLNENTKEFMNEVVYIGFMIYNKKKYKVNIELSPLKDDVILLREQLEKRWHEC